MSKGRVAALCVVVVFAIVSIFWLASGTPTSRSDLREGRVIGPNGTGIAAVLPEGWTGEIGSASNDLFTARRDTKVDESMLTCGGSSTYLAVDMFEEVVGSPWPRPTARPSRFTERTGRTEPGDGDQCFVATQYLAFSDHGRTFSAQVSIGHDVTDRQRQEAYSVLDSLRIRSPRSDAP